MRNKINLPQKEQIVKGKEALDLEEGSFVKVIHHKDGLNNGNILIRTNYDQRPFVNLQNGSLWHNSIENYTFAVLPYNTIDLKLVQQDEEDDEYDDDDF